MGRRLCIFGFCRSIEMLSDVVEHTVLEHGGEVCCYIFSCIDCVIIGYIRIISYGSYDHLGSPTFRDNRKLARFCDICIYTHTHQNLFCFAIRCL